MQRPTGMERTVRVLVIAVVALLAGCSSDDVEPHSSGTSPTASTEIASAAAPTTAAMSTISLPPTSDVDLQQPATSEATAAFAEVTLYHCGFNPITVRGELWEVPEEIGPFDATNAPAEWVGRGTIQRSDDGASLHYRDESGITLKFVPDDGRDPLCD